ncbi:MAG TPA: DoxX family protein [Burkholderiales bacterium]
MPALAAFTDAWSPRLLSILRIVSGFIFLLHGAQKLLGFPAPFPMPVTLFSMIGVAGLLELFGGALVMIGLFSRPVAFILSGEMAFAYFIGHAPKAFWPVLNGGDAAILYCFVFLYIAAAGPGPWSVDRWRNAP